MMVSLVHDTLDHEDEDENDSMQKTAAEPKYFIGYYKMITQMFYFRNAFLNGAFLLLLVAVASAFFLNSENENDTRVIGWSAFALAVFYIFVVFLLADFFDAPLSPHHVKGCRYLAPAFPFMLLWLGVALGQLRLQMKKHYRLLPVVVLIALFALGLFGVAPYFSYDQPGEYRDLPGFSYRTLTITSADYFLFLSDSGEEGLRHYLAGCDPAYRDEIDQEIKRLLTDLAAAPESDAP